MADRRTRAPKPRPVYGPNEVSDKAVREDRERDYVPRGEGEAAGWIRIGRYDSPRRRALWIRFVGLDDEAYPTGCAEVEMCSGREGDDAIVKLKPGTRIDAQVWADLSEVLLRAADHLPARWRAFDERQAAEAKK